MRSAAHLEIHGCLPAMRAAVLAAFIAFAAQTAKAQGADAVESFRPGTGQSSGQEPEYFPANVLGLPDTAARRLAPSVDPARILSLGRGGEIILRFDRAPIVDGVGADFTVFENAFAYTIGPRERIYAEPGEVAVSRDGVAYLAFPYDPRTLVGCAGVTPTNGDRSPIDPRVSGGDAFDLATLGIDSVRYVRITDFTSIVVDDPGHPYWDPTLSGFDLDAVVAIPLEARAVLSASSRGVRDPRLVAPNPARAHVSVAAGAGADVQLVDALGRAVVRERTVGPEHTVDCAALPAGRYTVVVTSALGVLRWYPLVIAR